jgi:hypothetical protein
VISAILPANRPGLAASIVSSRLRSENQRYFGAMRKAPSMRIVSPLI